MATRRRGLFPPAKGKSGDQHGTCTTCTLCQVPQTEMLMPNMWKSVAAQQVALQNLGLTPDSPVCHLCRNDIEKLFKNPDHKTRWSKQKKRKGNVLCGFM